MNICNCKLQQIDLAPYICNCKLQNLEQVMHDDIGEMLANTVDLAPSKLYALAKN